jgi:hypothetical protein
MLSAEERLAFKVDKIGEEKMVAHPLFFVKTFAWLLNSS